MIRAEAGDGPVRTPAGVGVGAGAGVEVGDGTVSMSEREWFGAGYDRRVSWHRVVAQGWSRSARHADGPAAVRAGRVGRSAGRGLLVGGAVIVPILVMSSALIVLMTSPDAVPAFAVFVALPFACTVVAVVTTVVVVRGRRARARAARGHGGVAHGGLVVPVQNPTPRGAMENDTIEPGCRPPPESGGRGSGAIVFDPPRRPEEVFGDPRDRRGRAHERNRPEGG